MRAQLVRLPDGPNHVSRPTGHGYQTVCSRVLVSEDLVVAPHRLWRKVWRLELQCQQCRRRVEQARNGRDLARLAGW